MKKYDENNHDLYTKYCEGDEESLHYLVLDNEKMICYLSNKTKNTWGPLNVDQEDAIETVRVAFYEILIESKQKELEWSSLFWLKTEDLARKFFKEKESMGGIKASSSTHDRRRKAGKETNIVSFDGDFEELSCASSEDAIMDSEFLNLIIKMALKRSAIDARDVDIIRKWAYGFSFSEIADTYQIKPETVRKRKNKILNILREIANQYE